MSSIHNHTLKAMGIFGGTQVFVIAFGILRNKFLAMWLGPVGVGLNAIYISTQELIVAAAGLSLRTGGVRELSAAPESGRARLSGVLLRMAALLACAGAAATLLLSPALSLWTMGSTADWWCFALLAAGVGAAIYLDADLAALQAYGRLKALARVTFVSAAVATAVAIPLYYGLGLRAVLPVYLLMTLTYAAWAARERRRLCPRPARVPLREAVREARPMLRLGMYLTLAAVMERLASYLFVVFMTGSADTGHLGLYQAGYTLVNTYVLVIFAAITNEYYPRLSAVSGSAMRTAAFAGGEFKVAAWVLMPVVVCFAVCSELVVRLLYASSFLAMMPYADLGMCGVVPRAFAYCMAFVILARGDGRTYVVTEGIGAVLGLVLRMAGYRYGGFAGIGVAYVLEYVLYGAVVVVAYRRYGLRLSRGVVGLCVAATALCIGCVALKYAIGWWAPAVAVLPWLVPVSWRRLFGRRRREAQKDKRLINNK